MDNEYILKPRKMNKLNLISKLRVSRILQQYSKAYLELQNDVLRYNNFLLMCTLHVMVNKRRLLVIAVSLYISILNAWKIFRHVICFLCLGFGRDFIQYHYNERMVYWRCRHSVDGNLELHNHQDLFSSIILQRDYIFDPKL